MDTTRLRELAAAALWTGRWYDAGCNTVQCDYSNKKEHDEIAHPCPLGITEYIAAVHPAAILEILDALDKSANTAVSGFSPLDRVVTRNATTV